jgi:NADP-dependent 3-hydroxy acid dehydrogenase YdfG
MADGKTNGAGGELAVIVGAGSGLSASLARTLAAAGMKVVLAARRPEKLADLTKETGASAIACDATKPAEVKALFEKIASVPDLVEVEGVGESRARAIKDGLARLAESSILERYV